MKQMGMWCNQNRGWVFHIHQGTLIIPEEGEAALELKKNTGWLAEVSQHVDIL